MKAILLARVSSKEQEEGQSIPAQERRLREHAERKNLIVNRVYKIRESSTKDIRKEFEKILAHTYWEKVGQLGLEPGTSGL
jgi:site-specific DNA recombinase